MTQRLHDTLARHDAELLRESIREQLKVLRSELIREDELRQQSGEFLAASYWRPSAAGEAHDDVTGSRVGRRPRPSCTNLREPGGARASAPRETATFVFSPQAAAVRPPAHRAPEGPDALAAETWRVSDLLDKLGLYTTEVYQKTREEVIARQQQEMLELSTPVVKLWDGILALPLIGTLDSARTQVVMENLLQRIVETGAEIAIIDITGVPTVDTLVAQHLLKTVAAARLMGADCIISGIRPQIAQTIVHLGVDLGDVITKATLADAFAVALERHRADRRPRDRAAPERGAPMERIPILKMGEFLLVTIQVDMHDRLAMTLQDDLTDADRRDRRARRADRHLGARDRRLVHRPDARPTSPRMARILDAETVVVGMQPAVAITLVELGLSLPGRPHGAQRRAGDGACSERVGGDGVPRGRADDRSSED